MDEYRLLLMLLTMLFVGFSVIGVSYLIAYLVRTFFITKEK